jgi:hypothetical protein
MTWSAAVDGKARGPSTEARLCLEIRLAHLALPALADRKDGCGDRADD